MTSTASTRIRRLRLGTRASPLALAQANQIAASLKAASDGEIEAEIVKRTTKGDQLTTERLINSGGKGLFTRELDDALAAGEIDIAVHSLKDVPARLPDGQVFVAFPPREDARDGFVSPVAERLQDLPEGAVLGTASLRREAQALALRPDLEVKVFRGNVQTRLDKLARGEAQATFLAMAGLNRLGLAHHARPVPVSDMLPAAAQGIIGVVAREDLDEDMTRLLTALNHPETEAAALAERAFLETLDGSCRTPIAAFLFDEGDDWRLAGEVLHPSGAPRWQDSGTCSKSAGREGLDALGRAVAGRILKAAGGALPAFGGEA